MATEADMAAIEALNEKEGSNKSSISRHIGSTIVDLPAAHTTLLSHHLNKMKQTGQLVFVKNNYMKLDSNAPPRRGRGRPPKPINPIPQSQTTAPADSTSDIAGAGSPRPRGRPPKQSTPSGSGKPRGRPPKKVKTGDEAAAPEGAMNFAPAMPSFGASASLGPAGESGAKVGRGRPPKAKPAAVEPVAG